MRKPKIPKGTRDFKPDQMTIKQEAFDKITSVFKRHGAVSIDTPVFELKYVACGRAGMGAGEASQAALVHHMLVGRSGGLRWI